jgi:hypothetical protein
MFPPAILLQQLLSGGGGGPDPIEVISGGTDVFTATRSPTINIPDGTSPAADGDVIVVWATAATVSSLDAVIGWYSVLGGVTSVNSDSHSQASAYHVVTPEEAGQTSWTITNFFSAGETGIIQAVRVRNVGLAAPISAAASTVDSANAASPHILAGIASGSVTVNDGLVLSAVGSDGGTTYTTPGGWTVQQSYTPAPAQSVYSRDTLTTSGVAVAATNVTTSVGNEYASITVIMNPTPHTMTTLTPNGTVSSGVWTPSSGLIANSHLLVDDSPHSPDDSDYVQASIAGTGTPMVWDMTATGASFTSASAIYASVRWSTSGFVDDTIRFRVHLLHPTHGAVTDSSSLVSTLRAASAANEGPITKTIPLVLNATGLANNNKTMWDDVQMRVEIDQVVVGGADGGTSRIYSVELRVIEA